MDRHYVSTNMLYFSQAFLFLAFGTIIFIFRGLGILSVTGITLIWFFGFVLSMVFGITNIMIPSYAKSAEFNRHLIQIEIGSLDSGIILLFAALNIKPTIHPVFIMGVSLLLLSILIHLYDVMFAARARKTERMNEEVAQNHVR
ncbi:MAG: hypothetical protein OWQ34_05660 [Thermoplasma acidophilum]|nr:hypothetical protein [Thermoplasma acidophilum]